MSVVHSKRRKIINKMDISKHLLLLLNRKCLRLFLDEPVFRQTFSWEFSKISRKTIFQNLLCDCKYTWMVSLFVVNVKNIRTTLMDIATVLFTQMFLSYTPWKPQNSGFLTCSGGIEMEHWHEMDEYWFWNWVPIDRSRRFNVDKILYNIIQRRINVETTSCVYRAYHMLTVKPLTWGKRCNIASPTNTATANAIRNMITYGNQNFLVNGVATTPISEPRLIMNIDTIDPTQATRKMKKI